MRNRGTLTRVLAIAGTVLMWLPTVAPVVLTAIFLASRGVFRFDFLMPAELLPLALLGGALLVWAAVRARSCRALIGGSLGIAVALLVGGQGLAVVTGLASGEIEPEGVWYVLALGAIIGYDVALIVAAVGGILLVRNVIRAERWA